MAAGTMWTIIGSLASAFVIAASAAHFHWAASARNDVLDFKDKIRRRSTMLLASKHGLQTFHEIGRDVFYGKPEKYWKRWLRKNKWSITTIIWDHQNPGLCDVVLTFSRDPCKLDAVLGTVSAVYDFEVTQQTGKINPEAIKNSIAQNITKARQQKIPVIIIPNELEMLVCIQNNRMKPRRFK